MQKCVIIMNPQSGKKKKIKNYRDFYDILRKHGYETEIIFTKKAGDATSIIQSLDDDIDLVINGGGDGTLNEIVKGNLKRNKKLTIGPLPMGSTNDVGNMYGLNKTVYENLEIIAHGKPKKVDICTINETPFVYVACLGDFIDMAYATPRSLKEKFGKLGYVIFGLSKLKNKTHSYRVKYTVNREEHEGEFAFFFITNSSRVAGMPDVYNDVKLNDNRFEVALAKAKNKQEMLRLVTLVTSVDIDHIPGITYYRTNHFEIEFLDEPKENWCIDGEEYKSEERKFIFDVSQPMKMQVPRKKISQLFNDEE